MFVMIDFTIIKKIILAAILLPLFCSCGKEIPIDGARLSPESLEMIEGLEPQKLYLYLYPSYTTDNDIVWRSEPEGIVRVNENGEVTPLSEGTAKVSVYNGSRELAFATVVVKPFIHVEAVSLSDTEINVSLGEPGKQLEAKLVPEDATDPTLHWTSSDEKVVSVDASGILTYNGEGSATVTVTTADGGKTAECMVTVTYTELESISVDPESMTVYLGGQSKQLSAVVTPSNASNPAVTWKSENPAVATVDEEGNVSAVSLGTVKIFATSVENSEISGYCTVEVSAEQVKGENLLKNPGFEAPDDGQDIIAQDWMVVTSDWFKSYYGTDAATMGVPQRSNNKGNFFTTGNGRFVPDIVTGHYVGRLPAAASSGMYQLVNVTPGKTYYFGANVAMVEVNLNQKIKEGESLKILSDDGTILYASVPMPSRDDNKTVVNIHGEVTIPEGVTSVRIQFDSRDYTSPAQNKAPLIMIDECEFCELQ